MECITEFTSKEDPKEKKGQNFTTGAELNMSNDLEKEKEIAVITVDKELNNQTTETKIKEIHFEIENDSDYFEKIKTEKRNVNFEENANLRKVNFPS